LALETPADRRHDPSMAQVPSTRRDGRGESVWARLRQLAALVLLFTLTPAAAREQAHEVADQPVPRRIDYDWMTVEQWHENHQRLLAARDQAAAAGAGAARVVWLGDSITEWWPRVGEDSWSEHWQPRGSLNLGLGGDSTQHLLWRLRHGALDQLQPRVVVLAIGTNNLHLSGHDDETIVAGIEAVIGELRARLPAADIVVSAILPRGRRGSDPLRGRIRAINAALEQRLADRDGITLVDAGSRMLGDDGSIDRAIMRDYLHLTDAGYRRWAGALLPAVDAALARPR